MWPDRIKVTTQVSLVPSSYAATSALCLGRSWGRSRNFTNKPHRKENSMQGLTELESFANSHRPSCYNDWCSSYVGGKWKERKLARHIWARTLRRLFNILQRGLYFTEGWEATGGLQTLELNDSFAISKDHSLQRAWQFLTEREPAWGEGRHPPGVVPSLWLEPSGRRKRPDPLPACSHYLSSFNMTFFHPNCKNHYVNMFF